MEHLMKFILFLTMVILSLVVIRPKSVHANLVVNGGLETWPMPLSLDSTPSNWNNFSDTSGATGLDPVSSSFETNIWNDLGGTPDGSSMFGRAFARQDGTGEGSSQSIATTLGTIYNISFSHSTTAFRNADAGSGYWDVFIDNVVIGSTPPVAPSSPWQSYSLNFIGTAGLTQNFGFIARTNTLGQTSSLVIDNVSVTAVPEPSAFLFLGLVGLSVGVHHAVKNRRRKLSQV
jgi:hypothetical protein